MLSGPSDPFRRAISFDLVDMLTDAAVDVLAERGLDRFSIGAVARQMGISPQAVNNRFPAAGGGKHWVIRLIVLTFCSRWERWVSSGLFYSPPRIALPSTPEEVHGVRVWAAFTELARGEEIAGHEGPAAAIARARAGEQRTLRARVSSWSGRPLAAADAGQLWFQAEGLRRALAAVPGPEIEYGAARDLIDRAVGRFAGEGRVAVD